MKGVLENPNVRMLLLQRFMKHVSKDPNGCWNWTGCKNRTGYGGFLVRSNEHRQGRRELAHRVSYELFKGPIPKGKFVCHLCDNTSCVNPDHVWAGTNVDNMGDMKRKGRSNKGESRWNSKLTNYDVKLIRKLYRRRSFEFGCPALAKRFGVSHENIRRALYGVTWKHVYVNEGI